jgi:hypothetical protein
MSFVKRSARPASPQSACWLDEQRKPGTRCLILDELPFPAALRQLVAVLVAKEENSLQKSFASVSTENKVGFLALLVRIAWKTSTRTGVPFRPRGFNKYCMASSSS